MQIAIMGHGMLGTVGGGAMTGIDMALWDIKGKALGVPVWNLLGGKVRDRIRIYAHANTPEVALSLKERGITAIKCGGVSDPVRKVAALREAVGDEMDIMIDLHGPPWLTPGDAAQLARALEPYNLLFYRRSDRAGEPRRLPAHPRRGACAAGRRRAHGDDLRRARADRARTGRRHPARHRPRRRHHADEEDRRHGRGAPHHDGAAFGLARPGGRICGAASAGRDPERAHPGAHRGRLGGPRADGRAASRCRDGLSARCPMRRALACDIDEAFVARFPSDGNVSVPVSSSPAPTPPAPTTSIVYVQTRLQRAATYCQIARRTEQMKIDRLRVFMTRDKDRPRVIVAIDTDDGHHRLGRVLQPRARQGAAAAARLPLRFIKGQDPRRIEYPDPCI